MLVEELFLTSFKIKNIGICYKQFYVILRVEECIDIFPVIKLEKTHSHTLVQKQQKIKINQDEEILMEFWNYDNLNKIKTIQLPTQKLVTNNYAKVLISGFQIQIFCQNKRINSIKNKSIKLKNQIEYFEQKKAILSLKNSKIQQKVKYRESQFNLSKKSENFISFYEEEEKSLNMQNDTSLQKIMNKQLKKQNYKVDTVQKSKTLRDLIQNRKLTKFNTVQNIFDDYETNPQKVKRITSIKDNKIQEIKNKNHSKQISRQVNSTNSSSMIKKTLQNTIKHLIQGEAKPSKINKNLKMIDSKDYQYDGPSSLNSYGIKSQSKLSKSKSSITNSFKKPKQSSIYRKYKKDLTKKQLRQVQRMNSVQLSKSIFQQYGLNLSLNVVNESKNYQKTKDRNKIRINNKNQQNPLQKNKNQQSNNIQSKEQHKLKGQKLFKFQDYGQLNHSNLKQNRKISKSNKKIFLQI